MAAKHLLLIQELSDGVFLSEEREDFGVHIEDVGLTLLVALLLVSLDGHLESNQRSGEISPTQIPRLNSFTSSEPATGPDPPRQSVTLAFLNSVEEEDASYQKPGSICSTPGAWSGSTVLEARFLPGNLPITDGKKIRGDITKPIGG